MRKLLVTSVIAVIALAGCTQTDQPNGVAVRGYQVPGGWGVQSAEGSRYVNNVSGRLS